MKRITIIAGVLGGLGLLARRARRRVPALQEHLMEDVMPGMMDHCFSQMGHERREFMLTHCRGMLDQMEAKYLSVEPDDVVDSPAEPVAPRVSGARRGGAGAACLAPEN